MMVDAGEDAVQQREVTPYSAHLPCAMNDIGARKGSSCRTLPFSSMALAKPCEKTISLRTSFVPMRIGASAEGVRVK